MTTFIQHIYNRTTCNCSALDSWGQQPNFLYLLVHSKFLCLTVSNSRKMWHGHSLMARHWHIQHSTQNLLLRSAWRCHRSGSPKHHHCLPKTLLPKMLVSKSSVGLIWIYIYSQLQTNIWDYVVGTGSSKVSVALFCACFLKKMLNLRSFTACLCAFNPWIREQKNFLLLRNWVHFVPIFFKLFSQQFSFKIKFIDSIVVKTSLLFRILIFLGII